MMGRLVVAGWWLGILGVGLVVTACKRTETEPVAQIEAADGDVKVKPSEEGAPAAAVVNQGLFEGNVVATGEQSTATVDFRGGNRLEIQPNSTLVVRKSGGSLAELGVVLLAGSANATSKGGGVLLAIGTPFGLTELGGTETSLQLSTEQGLKVLVGEVTVLLDNGTRTAVKAGGSFTVEGLLVTVAPAAPVGEEDANLVLNPMEVVLLANPKQVQVKRRGEDAWRAPRKKEVLSSEDAVRTRKATGTQIQFGDSSGLSLSPGTEMTVTEAGLSQNAQRARYALKSGNLAVAMKQTEGVRVKHELQVGGQTATVEPGLKEGAVEVSASESGRTQITVRFGRVVLADGTVINAGSAVNLQGNKIAGEVHPLAVTALDLKPQSNSIVYYTTEVPPIEFSWSEAAGPQGYQFEVANDRGFTSVIFREQLAKATFVYDQFAPGRYYWRVKGAGDWSRGVLSIEKKRDSDCANCRRNNTIDDTGEKTVVYYQKALPSITLRWKAVDGATSYRVKVYPDGEFETPLADKASADTSLTFPEGQFEEGKYYWHIVALAGSGKEIATGRMNTLQIAYDNAIVDLSIKAPRPGQRVGGGSVVTRGEVQLGAKLTVNGNRVNLDSKGRFRETVKLSKGSNQIVYRTLSSDGIARFYVRDVYSH